MADKLHVALKGTGKAAAKATQAVDYHRWMVLGVILALAICIGFASCSPKTPSLLVPGKMVTAPELQREVITIQGDYDVKLKAAEVAKEDLQRQVDFRRQVVGIIGGLGTTIATGGLDPASGVAAGIQLLTLLGLGGAVLDIKRKNKIIKNGATAKA